MTILQRNGTHAMGFDTEGFVARYPRLARIRPQCLLCHLQHPPTGASPCKTRDPLLNQEVGPSGFHFSILSS